MTGYLKCLMHVQPKRSRLTDTSYDASCLPGRLSWQLPMMQKRHRAGKDKKVEDCLVKWFSRVRARDARITQEMLLAQSEKLAKMMGHQNFKASRRWLHRLMKRSDMKHKKLWGEAGSADLESREKWLTDVWPKLQSEYEPQDIWNADESGLNYRDAQKSLIFLPLTPLSKHLMCSIMFIHCNSMTCIS